MQQAVAECSLELIFQCMVDSMPCGNPGLFLLFLLQAQRRVAEQRLLEVRGVISFTFDLPEKRCTVRVRSTLKPEVR